jgi:hypothetical protein
MCKDEVSRQFPVYWLCPTNAMLHSRGVALQGVTAQIKLGATGKDRLRHPYDLGPWENINSILGDDPSAWLLPCQSTSGGLSYPTTFDKKSDFFSF